MYRGNSVTFAIIYDYHSRKLLSLSQCIRRKPHVCGDNRFRERPFPRGRFYANMVYGHTYYLYKPRSGVRSRTMKERGNVRNCHGNNGTIAIIATTGEAINRIFYKENSLRRGGWMAEGKKIIKKSSNLSGVKNKNRYFFIGQIFYYYTTITSTTITTIIVRYFPPLVLHPGSSVHIDFCSSFSALARKSRHTPVCCTRTHLCIHRQYIPNNDKLK